MSIKLRVLVVEDSENDALLMLRELRKGGYEPDYERVDTKAAMMSALQSREWDVIICDFNMPSFRGDHALSLLKESGLDVPFILLSGIIGEETAVNMMKAGAHDYIMKDNLARLVPAIQRELGEAKNRQEKREAQVALQQSEEQYRMILHSMHDLIFIFDKHDRYSQYYTSNEELLFALPKEFLGRHVREVLPPSVAERFMESIQRVRETGGSEAFDYQLEMDGQKYWFSAVLSMHEDGESIVQVVRNITRRKQAEEALRESEEWFRAIYEESPIAINVFDPDGNLIHANPALLDFAGVSSVKDMKGFNIFDDPNFPEDKMQQLRNGKRVLFQSAIDWAKTKKARLYDTHKSGVSYVKAGASALRYGEDESLHGYMVQIVDITERVMAEANTKAAAETAMLYLDLMGHDIRNHLQAIILGTEIVGTLDVRPEVKQMFDIIVDSVENSQNLIGKVQSTRDLLLVPLANTSLREALDDCLQVINETYTDVQIEVNWNAQQPTVLGDKYLGTLLMNILENAILHNAKKKKRVWLDLREVEEGYEVTIADNGPGIVDEIKESLFDQDRRFGGVGVHQALKIAQKYGGRISVRDRVPGDSSKGAEFHVWLPKSTP